MHGLLSAELPAKNIKTVTEKKQAQKKQKSTCFLRHFEVLFNFSSYFQHCSVCCLSNFGLFFCAYVVVIVLSPWSYEEIFFAASTVRTLKHSMGRGLEQMAFFFFPQTNVVNQQGRCSVSSADFTVIGTTAVPLPR